MNTKQIAAAVERTARTAKFRDGLTAYRRANKAPARQPEADVDDLVGTLLQGAELSVEGIALMKDEIERLRVRHEELEEFQRELAGMDFVDLFSAHRLGLVSQKLYDAELQRRAEDEPIIKTSAVSPRLRLEAAPGGGYVAREALPARRSYVTARHEPVDLDALFVETKRRHDRLAAELDEARAELKDVHRRIEEHDEAHGRG